jgi:DNA-binding transcriptional LysR family regulator
MHARGEMTVFTRVVDSGSFSAAGRQLGLSPSAVSKLISRLEDRLGARLLQRTTRQLSLTEQGRNYYRRAKQILADIDEAEAEVSAAQTTPSGTLRVNGSVAFTKYQVVPRLPAFLQAHPDLHIELELTDRPIDLLQEEVDVAIRLADPQDSSLIVRRLATNRRMVVAAPSYIEKFGAPETPQDLIKHNCLRISAQSSLNDWDFSTPEGHNTVHVQGNFEVNDGDSLHQAVLAGIGIARLATYLVGPDIHSGKLIPLLADFTHDRASIYVAYPHRRHLSPKVRAFVDFLVATFTPNPPWRQPSPDDTGQAT